ncbi:MAG: hypothetical protein O3A63_10205 [Proteobacteria bacterium]|nr:hypothetical protein [Pseudomonadota bacterium]
MKKLIVLIVALGCGYALADDLRVESSSLNVKERLETIELINVTEERAPVETAAALDADLEAILKEAAALEEPQTVN